MGKFCPHGCANRPASPEVEVLVVAWPYGTSDTAKLAKTAVRLPFEGAEGCELGTVSWELEAVGTQRETEGRRGTQRDAEGHRGTQRDAEGRRPRRRPESQ